MSSASPQILIVAAEASSSLYARRLLEHWRRRKFDIKAFGVGDSSMQTLGFEIVGRSEDMAVVGLLEVLRHLRAIRRIMIQLIQMAVQRRPAVALLLDYPDFNFRLAKKLKALGVPVVYYISPQIWAWRRGRIKLVQKYVDKMLVVLPFEKDFYYAHGVNVEFVGHPLLDELNPDWFDKDASRLARAAFGLPENRQILGLMPGSRHGEIHHHLSLQLEVCRQLQQKYQDLHFVFMIAPSLSVEEINTKIVQAKLPETISYSIIKDNPMWMAQVADVMLVVSGTATLMVGLMEKPMVIIYRVNPISAFIGQRLVKVRFFGLPNLILNRKVVPELKQSQATVAEILSHLCPMLESADVRTEIRQALAQLKISLGQSGATRRVANQLETYFTRVSQ